MAPEQPGTTSAAHSLLCLISRESFQAVAWQGRPFCRIPPFRAQGPGEGRGPGWAVGAICRPRRQELPGPLILLAWLCVFLFCFIAAGSVPQKGSSQLASLSLPGRLLSPRSRGALHSLGQGEAAEAQLSKFPIFFLAEISA